jgi:nucleotide-binding universal stress UspA family protein
MIRTRRIVAGVSDSPGNLPALRHAADLARVYDAALTFVHAWLPSGPGFAAWQFPSDPLVMQWQDDAWRRMWHALDTAFGGSRRTWKPSRWSCVGTRARSWSTRPAGTATGWS